MVYSRYYRSKRPAASHPFTRRRRTTFYRRNRKGYDWAGMAKAAYKTAKTAISLLNVEHKVFDVTQAGVGVSSSGLLNQLHLISQGDTQVTRDGNEIKLESLLVRFTATIEPLNTPTTRLRYILFKDMQSLPGAAAPAVSDLLENTSFPIISPLNIVNANAGQRFVILKDKVFELDAVKRPQFTYEKFMKISDHLHYVGANTTDIISPVYYILFISDQSSMNDPTVEFYVRSRFIDN